MTRACDAPLTRNPSAHVCAVSVCDVCVCVRSAPLPRAQRRAVPRAAVAARARRRPERPPRQPRAGQQQRRGGQGTGEARGAVRYTRR